MTHNEKRSSWGKEGLAALISGVTYGITNVIVGSPMDVVKTKMQVFEEYKSKNAFQSAKLVYQRYGIKGFFKGITGPLIGSSVFRAVTFASFEAFYTKVKDNKFLTSKIPFTYGLELRVIIGGIISGTSRAIIECPFEYTKVRRQTN
jgi:solute carrier family 25 carnitine/acylcarnitine transporter 20/29